MRNDTSPDTDLDAGLPRETQESGSLAPSLLRSGDILAARYEIKGLVGRGGMASVYRAFDRVTEETIAIKMLDPERSVSRA